MKRKHIVRYVVALGMGLSIAMSSAVAHHGSAVSYDLSKQITLEGVVTRWVWKNPHCFVLFDVSGKGETVNWGAETHPTNFMVRNEVDGVHVPWDANTLKPGDSVTITLFPSRVGTPRGLLSKVVAADGTVLLDDGGVRLRRR